MSDVVNVDELISTDLSQLCRGCLSPSSEMKNMEQWGLVDDFQKFTNVQINRSDNPSLMLCCNCQDFLYKCRTFQLKCQQSDTLLRTVLEKRLFQKGSDRSRHVNSKEHVIKTEFKDSTLVVKIIAHNMDTKIYFPCPYECQANFLKRTDLLCHLLKQHKVTTNFTVVLEYYCPESYCSYNINSGQNKHFPGRKYLNQHTLKVHHEKVNCKECNLQFSSEVHYKRHLKTCNDVYKCKECEIQFNKHESFLIHLLRKHPTLHEQYKVERKAKKRRREVEVDTKKVKLESDKTDYLWDSPKRSFATQTMDLKRHIKNDVTLPPWQGETTDELKKENIFSFKSNMSEDDSIYTDAVSLSDIQTQTEIGLSRLHKETITSETQSPDLSIKETQTCVCLYNSPKPNIKFSDSLTSSPSNPLSMLTSTETQTLDYGGSLYNDMLLSFSSAETQTSFDDLNKGF